MEELVMLRVVISLDCDQCRQSYYQAAVSSDTKSIFWQSYAEDLLGCASMDGWFTDGDRILCKECVEDDEAECDKQEAAVAVS